MSTIKKAKSRKHADLPSPVSRDRGMPLATPIELQRSFYTSVYGQLKNPSLPVRLDRGFQRMMRNDPDVMSPLLALQLLIAASDWTLEPEDPSDARQFAEAQWTTTLLRRMPRWSDFVLNLCDCAYYGCGVANHLLRQEKGRGWSVSDWLPIHPDTMACDVNGQLGLRVGARYMNQESTTTPGFDSHIHWLDDNERQSLTLAVFRPQGAEFETTEEAARTYLGVGLRDVVWFTWQGKQATLQNWVAFCERYAMAVRIGYYPTGNVAAKAEVERILRNLIGDMGAVLPRDPDSERDTYEIKLLEANATNADVFREYTDRAALRIKELIQGQTGTSDSTSEGLGSSVGDRHAMTMYYRVRYLARVVAEAISRDLVSVLTKLNFGEDAVPPRLVFGIDRPDAKEFLEAVERAIAVGGEVPWSQLQERLGFRAKVGDEKMLSRDSGPVVDFTDSIDGDGDGADDPARGSTNGRSEGASRNGSRHAVIRER